MRHLSLRRPNPDGDIRGLERARRGRRELGEDGFDVDRVAQPGAEGGDCRLGVVARAVEAAVDEPLQPRAAAG